MQEELVNSQAHINFIKHLQWEEMPARQRILAAFVLTSIMDGYRPGQEACLHHLLHNACLSLLVVCVAGHEVRRIYFVSLISIIFVLSVLSVLFGREVRRI